MRRSCQLKLYNIINAFDNINLKNLDLDSFKLIIFANRQIKKFFHLEAFLCKADDKGNIAIADFFTFDLPKEKENLDTDAFSDTEVYVKNIDLNNIKKYGTGIYVLLIYGEEIDEERYNPQISFKSTINLKEASIKAKSKLKVIYE